MVRVSPRAVRWALRAGIVAFGAVQARADRYAVSPDGVSYLNLSDAWASGQWSAGISGYWSPLYPAVLGLARALTHASAAGEAPLVHAVILIFMVLSLVGFEMFLSELRARERWMPSGSSRRMSSTSSESAWWDVFTYGLFAWGALTLIGVGTTTPDMIVAAVLYFAGALTLRCHRAPSPAALAALGLVLGLGFLAKGALLGIAVIWLAAIAAGFGIRAKWPVRLLAPAVFLAVSLPLIATLSERNGRLTFEDAGRVNRGWQVNRYPMIWTGLPPGSGKPVHAPLVVNDDPLVIRYPDGPGSSYPFFDDPSYWTEGMTPHFDLGKQARSMMRQLRYYARSIGPLVLALALLSLLSKPRTVMLRGLGSAPSLSLSMLALIGGYASVVTQTRFIAASVVILAVLAFDAFRRAAAPPPTPILVAVAAAASILFAWKGRHVIHQSLMVVREVSGNRIPNRHLAIATALSKAGLERGAKVGVVGGALQGYWARLAGVRIVAEVPSTAAEKYWAASDSVRSAVEGAFWRSGVRVIVASGRYVRADRPGWEPLVEGYFVNWPPGSRTESVPLFPRSVPTPGGKAAGVTRGVAAGGT